MSPVVLPEQPLVTYNCVLSSGYLNECVPHKVKVEIWNADINFVKMQSSTQFFFIFVRAEIELDIFGSAEIVRDTISLKLHDVRDSSFEKRNVGLV